MRADLQSFHRKKVKNMLRNARKLRGGKRGQVKIGCLDTEGGTGGTGHKSLSLGTVRLA